MGSGCIWLLLLLRGAETVRIFLLLLPRHTHFTELLALPSSSSRSWLPCAMLAGGLSTTSADEEEEEVEDAADSLEEVRRGKRSGFWGPDRGVTSAVPSAGRPWGLAGGGFWNCGNGGGPCPSSSSSPPPAASWANAASRRPISSVKEKKW